MLTAMPPATPRTNVSTSILASLLSPEFGGISHCHRMQNNHSLALLSFIARCCLATFARQVRRILVYDIALLVHREWRCNRFEVEEEERVSEEDLKTRDVRSHNVSIGDVRIDDPHPYKDVELLFD
jgi:hypothetical protein